MPARDSTIPLALPSTNIDLAGTERIIHLNRAEVKFGLFDEMEVQGMIISYNSAYE